MSEQDSGDKRVIKYKLADEDINVAENELTPGAVTHSLQEYHDEEFK